MKNITKVLSLLLFVGALSAASFGQTALIQTTLASSQGIGPVSLAGGTQGNLQTTINLTSATGVQTAAFGAQPVTFVYIDQELEGILSLVPGQTTLYNVLRAQSGTTAAYHANASMVLIGTQSPQFGGYAGSGGFQQVDPPLGGVCNLANTGLTPWVNIRTGAQWLCTSVLATPATNGQWAPSWNNPLAAVSPLTTAAVASAAALLPSGPFFHVTGATGITSFLIPVGFNATAAGYGSFCFTTDSTATTAVGNNIGTAVTGVAGQVECWKWDATNSKFYAIP